MFGIKILEEQESKYNGKLRVVRSFGLGTYIQAKGLTQSGGVVESIWKQTLNHIKNKSAVVNSCLILGLGGGTVAKLVRKSWPKAKITGVDIDADIIELGRKYLGIEDAVDIKIQDAIKPVPGRFDLVIVDLYQGDEFPKKFETEKFLKFLRKNKLVIFNRLYYKDKKISAEKFGKNLQKIFSNVEYYHPVSNLMLICSS